MTADQFITDQCGPAETVTMSRGKLAQLLDTYVAQFEQPETPEDPELEPMRDKFNDWLDARIAAMGPPTNWIDMTAEFVLEQVREREKWQEVFEP